MAIKVVGFDFFGTLVDAQADSKSCILSMCKHLRRCGYDFSDDDFLANYRAVVRDCRKIRHDELREVNNCVWVADTLRRMGMEAEASSPDVVSAVEEYFGPWKLSIVPDAPRVLEDLSGKFKVVLVSNFTDSAFLHRALKRLGIGEFFDNIIDSDTVGWRKPHQKIFKHLLKSSNATAEETVFIGDDLEIDIKGAKDMGIKAVLLARPGHEHNQQAETKISPDHIVGSLTEYRELIVAGEI